MIVRISQIQPTNSLYFNQPKPEDQERRKRTKSFSRILAKAMQNPPQGLPGKIMI